MLPKMTNIEIVERTIAQLNDKRDRVTQRSSAISAERQQLGFAVHANNDKAAAKKLSDLNAEFLTLAGEIESIDGALVEQRSAWPLRSRPLRVKLPRRMLPRYASCLLRLPPPRPTSRKSRRFRDRIP
jgi:hypothetical protein